MALKDRGARERGSRDRDNRGNGESEKRGGGQGLQGVESTLEITTRNDTDDGDRFPRNAVEDTIIAGA